MTNFCLIQFAYFSIFLLHKVAVQMALSKHLTTSFESLLSIASLPNSLTKISIKRFKTGTFPDSATL